MQISKVILSGLIAFGCSLSALSQQHASVSEAIDMIWKMKHKEIYELYETVFPEECSNSFDEEKRKEEIEECVFQATKKIDAIYNAIDKNIAITTTVGRVLKAYISADIQEQEMLEAAIKGSYREYISFNMVGALVALITFPIGVPILMMHHMKHVRNIETKRGCLTEVVDDFYIDCIPCS